MSPDGRQRYLVALGSNVRHPRHGRPADVLRAAVMALDGEGLSLGIAAPQVVSEPIGRSTRRYANTVALIASRLDPPGVLARLQGIERAFGRRRRGARWGPRVLDLDIVLWSGGNWRAKDLTIPHPEFRRRGFVLGPAAHVAPRWRDPQSGLRLAHLAARLTRRRPLPTAPARAGP